MFGNGVPTGTTHTPVTVRQIQRVLHWVRTGCFAVAVGTSVRSTVALRIGLGTIQTTVTTTTGSGLFCPQFVNTHSDYPTVSLSSKFLLMFHFFILFLKNRIRMSRTMGMSGIKTGCSLPISPQTQVQLFFEVLISSLL